MTILNKRIEWVDIFKGLIILLVVIGHTNSPMNVYIYLFHVPAFFFISGYTTSFDGEAIKDFALKRIRTLMIPFYSINIILLVLNVILTGTPISKFLTDPLHKGELLNSILSLFLHGAGPAFGGATWFLLVLFGASILVKILFILCKKYLRAIQVKDIEVWFLFAASILLLLLGYYLYAIKRQSNYLLDLYLNAQLYIVLGILFRKFMMFEKSNKIIFKITLITAAVLTMYYFSEIHWAPMNWPTRAFSANPLNNVLSSLAGIYLTYVLSNIILRAKIIKDIFIYLGICSLSVLAFHFLGMKVSYFIFYYVGILPYDQLKQFVPPVNNYWPLLTITSVLFSLGVDYIVNKNKLSAFIVLGKKFDEGSEHLKKIINRLPYLQVFINILKMPFRAPNKYDEPGNRLEYPSLFSRPARFHSRYKETFIVVGLLGLVIFFLNRPAFDGFFMGEDFNWRSLYLAADGDFFKAIFTPIMGIFLRPASIAWVIGTQLVLPWDPVVHHIRNFLFTLINLFLLYRVMLRVTASRSARMIGIVFFSISMVHITTIGLINAMEIIVTLMHFLLTLLFLIRYFQERKRSDYFLSIICFTLGVFSRDYSVVFIAVVGVLFYYYAYENYIIGKSSREAVLKYLPFVLVACGYLLIRYTIVGLPKAGGTAPYAINFDVGKILKDAYIYVGSFLNLSLSPDVASFGQGDLSTLLTNNRIYNRIYEIIFLALSSTLFILTIAKGISHKKWCIFSLVWSFIIIAPTFLISRPFIYYIYESVAAMAILLSICLDYKAPGRKIQLGLWTLMLLVIGINGYAHNQNVGSFAWRWVANIAYKVNQQIFIPNRGLPTRSLLIVTPNIEQAQLIQYVVQPLNPGGMIKALMNDQGVVFHVKTIQDYDLATQISQHASDLVYFLEDDYSFKRVLPMQKGPCTSFEGDLVLPKIVWVLNSSTVRDFNNDSKYISDGEQSIKISVSAEGKAENHFGGIELPLPKNYEFVIDLWLDDPRKLKTIYAFEIDEGGHAVNAWVNSNPGESLVAGAQSNLIFRLGASNKYGFKWIPQKQITKPKALHFFVDVRDGERVDFYLDQLCGLL